MRCLILLLPIVLAACATTGSGDGGISIETQSRGQPLPGAVCAVSTGAGKWTVTTPAAVQVGSASGDLRVVCNKPGFRTSELIFKPSNPAGSNVGVGVGGGGGHVGVGLGMNFPIRLGGGGYPARVVVDMNPQ